MPFSGDIHDIGSNPYAEFRLEEQNPGSADERLDNMRSHLRATWPVQTDTFVTGELPLLLTRAAQIARVRSRKPLKHDE